MVTLDVGNVLLKPSHRRLLMSRLKRIIRLGERLGAFVLKLGLRRSGRHVEIVAQVQDRVGQFACRTRKSSLQDALREMIGQVQAVLHAHQLRCVHMGVAT